MRLCRCVLLDLDVLVVVGVELVARRQRSSHALLGGLPRHFSLGVHAIEVEAQLAALVRV